MSINQHDGARLASLTLEELIALLDLRVATFKADMKRDYDCPPNRIPGICGIVEVLNAISPCRKRGDCGNWSAFDKDVVNCRVERGKQ